MKGCTVCLFINQKITMTNIIRTDKSRKSLVLILDSSDVSSLLGVDLNSLSLNDAHKGATDSVPSSGKRYVYGLKGIQELFNVSHGTAQKYKDGILKNAVFQSGRKIVVDVDKALELFNSRNGR